MTLPKAPLTGSVVLPDGQAATGLSLTFHLAQTDTADGVVVLPAAVVVAMDGTDLPAGVELYRNTAGLRGTITVCTAEWVDETPTGRHRRSARLGRFQVGDADGYDIAELLDQIIPDDLGEGWYQTITQAQYDRAIEAEGAAQGWAAVSEQAAGQATAGVVALAASTAAGLSATAADDLFAVSVPAVGGDPARLDLYINDAGTARLLLTDYRPNAPLVPLQAPAAPAIVTAQSALKSGGVPMKMVLGSNYSVSQNAAAIFNSVSADICGAGLKITNPDKIEARCTGVIYARDNMDLEDVLFVKAYDAIGIQNSFFRHVDYAVDLNNIRLTRTTFRTLNSSMRGAMGRLFVNGLTVKDCEVSGFYNGQGWFLDGTDLDIFTSRFATDATMWGTGALRIGYCKNVRVIGNWIKCHDDGLMVLPGLNSQIGLDARRALGAQNVLFEANRVDNAAKFCIINLPQKAAAATVPWPYMVDNIRVINNSGYGCSRGFVIGNPSDAGAQSAVFDNIYIEGNTLYVGSTDLSARHYVFSKLEGGVKRVTFKGNRVIEQHSGTSSRVMAKIKAAGAEVTLENEEGGGRAAILHCDKKATINVIGGKFQIIDQADIPEDDDPEDPPEEGDDDAGGSGDDDPAPIVLDHDGSGFYLAAGAGSTSVIRLSGKVQIDGIRSNGSAVRVLAGTAIVPELVASKKAGATGTYAVSGASGTTVEIGDRITGTADYLTTHGDAAVKYLPRRTTSIIVPQVASRMTARQALGSRLITAVSARALTAVLKSTGGDPVGAVGDVVGQMLDLSGTGPAITQGNNANRPLMASDAGLWSVKFDGSNDYMASDDINLSAHSEIWLWAAINKTSDAAQSIVIAFGNSVSANASGTVELCAPGTGGALFSVRAQGSNNVGVSTSDGAYAAPWRGVIGAHVNFATDVTELYVGTSVVASSASDQGASALANTALRLGGRTSGTLPFSGHLHGAEVIVGAMTTDEIAAVVARLSALQT